VTFALGFAFLAIVERPYRSRWVPWFWVSLGFTFLAKGVFGPVLVVVPMGLVFALQRDRRTGSDFLRPNWGMAAALALFLAWVVPLVLMGGRECLVEVFLRNTAGRFFADPNLVPRTGRLGEHGEPFYFYLIRTPAGLLPWAAVWIGGLGAAFPGLRTRFLDPRKTFLPILQPFTLARELEARGAKVYQGGLTETQLGYASLELRHVLPPAATPEAVRAALEAPEPVALLLEPTIYWKQVLKPLALPGVEVPLAAAQSREIWYRTPVLFLNERAWELQAH
jgi:hypothetical protein